MRDKDLYQRILGLEAPWAVTEVELDLKDLRKGEIRVHVAGSAEQWPCPECSRLCPGYDHLPRRWRHLDTCQYPTILVAMVPRVNCPDHGVKQIRVPWGEPGSRFTALFEALIIDWLKEASVSAVARQLGLTWHEVDGVMSGAVRRGLARRTPKLPRQIGVDETSFQRRHEYVTVVIDREAKVVSHVADGRGREVLDAYYESHPLAQREAVLSVTMDMWGPYIASTYEHIPSAETKIAFDKFHVAQHLGTAVDKVRRQEHRVLRAEGDEQLTKTKYLWLSNPDELTDEAWQRFEPLRRSSLKTARAWAIKEYAMSLWSYRRPAWAQRAWQRWYSWAIRSRLEPIKKVARMVKTHLDGIVTAVVKGITNARSESVNAKIQWLKYTARGFRNRERFRNAIYFHLGGLDLYPAGVSGATHTNP
ncbi:MAG: ISL3 family transposase [Acidobacteria bacterium]|nr:ISL3 family transposase [Acidobacteriota bacterium]